jgi:Glycosyltransferases involved in cell wall biogenesis
MNDIKVSIITPSYNQGQFIEETILSVLNQTYKNIEYILIDGGSTDQTMEIVDKYKDRIDIVISEKDKGQSDAINKGFRLANGVLSGWINSDDILYPTCVEELVKTYTEKPDAAVFYTSYLDFINASGGCMYTRYRSITKKNDLLYRNYDIHQQASFYNSELLKRVDYLDVSVQYCMDLDLWLRLLEYGSIVPISDKPLGAFRIWEATKTSTGTLAFLSEIRNTLQQNGVKSWGKLVLKTYYLELRFRVARLVKKFILRR